jgi:hypothetical protein
MPRGYQPGEHALCNKAVAKPTFDGCTCAFTVISKGQKSGQRRSQLRQSWHQRAVLNAPNFDLYARVGKSSSFHMFPALTVK